MNERGISYPARMQSGYTFYVASARKLVWLPVVNCACSLVIVKWTLPVHLAAILVSLLAMRALKLRTLTVRRFLLAGNASYLAPLLSLSVLVFALATENVGIGLTEHTYQIALALGAFSIGSLMVYRPLWATLRTLFESAARDNKLSLDAALALLMGRGRLSFWRSGTGLALMISAGALSAWIGFRFGLEPKALVVCTLFFVMWIILLGAVLAQALTVARHTNFASITLYREMP